MFELLKEIKLPDRGLSARQRLILYRQLKRMLRITTLSEAVSEIGTRSRESKKGAHRAKACDLMISGLKRNINIGESIKTMAPTSECVILMVGEKNGRLTESLDALIYIIEAQNGVTKSIVTAVAYPAGLLLVVLAMYVGFDTQMLPIIKTIMKPEKWASITHTVVDIARFISSYWWVMIIAFTSCIYALFKSMPAWVSDFRDTLDKYPVYGTYRDLQSAIFMLALSSMQKAGAPLDESIKQIKSLSTPWMERHLDNMIWKLKKERQAGDAIDVGLIPKDLMSDVKIATQSGDLDVALEELGKEAINDFKDKVNLLSSVIGPLGLLFVGANIALIGLAYFGAVMPS